jgi:hypothetical protein
MASVTIATVIGAAMTGVPAATGIAIAGAMAAGRIPIMCAAAMSVRTTVVTFANAIAHAIGRATTAVMIGVTTVATIVIDLRVI